MADWLIHITRLFVKTVALFFALIFGVTGIAMLVAVVGGRPVMAVVERLPSAISSVAPIYFGAFFIIIPVAVALAIGALSAFLILTGRPKGELLASLITSDGQSLLEY